MAGTSSGGVGFAFAGQFAPQMMLEAIQIYREFFKPSATLTQPHVMIQPIFTPPPVASMNGLWYGAEQRSVETFLGAAVIGGPKTVARKLREFLQRTQADELILYSDLYQLADRLHSYEIVAGLFLKPVAQQSCS